MAYESYDIRPCGARVLNGWARKSQSFSPNCCYSATNSPGSHANGAASRIRLARDAFALVRTLSSTATKPELCQQLHSLIATQPNRANCERHGPGLNHRYLSYVSVC